MASGYEYRALNAREEEFRLLVFDNTEAFHPKRILNCHLQHESMRRAALVPDFHAISYTWGDTSKRATIIVGGKQVSVPKNAEVALRRFTNELLSQGATQDGRPRRLYLWIDVVCINHADRKERSRQLSLINAIYSEAKTVLIWLGEDDDALAEAAVQSIEDVVEQCRTETNDLADLFKRLWDTSARKLSIRSSKDALPQSCDLAALRSFFSSTWFTRLWVISEVCLAKQAICFRGSSMIPFYNVALAAQWMWYRGRGRLSSSDQPHDSHVTGIRNATEMWDCMAHSHATPKLLWTILAMTMEFQTTDPLDKIYGLYGLIELWLEQIPEVNLRPDYSISQAELYASATRAAILDAGNLAILGITSRAVKPDTNVSTKEVEMPSWAPRFDWTMDRAKGSTCFIQAPLRGACNGSPVRLRAENSLPTVLAVEGLILDEISHVSELWTVDYAPLVEKTSEAVGVHLLPAWSIATQYASPKLCAPLELAFAVALCAGQDTSFMPITTDAAFHSHCTVFFQGYSNKPFRKLRDVGEKLLHVKTKRDSGVADDAVGDPSIYAKAINNVCYNRKFIVTRGGRIGVGPKDLKVHDHVCLVPGSAVPLVLRKNGVFWRLIGDAYVHGVMDVSYAPV